MPMWPWQRPSPTPIHVYPDRPTNALEERALDAFFIKKDWPLAERLFREVIDKADPEGQRLARIDLGKTLEHMRPIDAAIVHYEANVHDELEVPFSAARLAIIYHKQRRPRDELRIVQIAIAYYRRLGETNEWWERRLASPQLRTLQP